MSLQFQSLKVKQVVRETADAISIHFGRPRTAEFHYKSGQYLTLRATINGEDLRRAYSLCSSPFSDDDLVVTVKQVTDGRMSNHLATTLKAGDTLEVFPPMGKFTVETKPSHAKHYVLIGGGSGVTPLMSILKTVLKMEPGSKVTLIYANRDANSIIFKDQLAEFGKKYPDRLRVIHSLDQADAGWTGLTGRLDKSVLLQLGTELVNNDKRPASFYLCGPEGLMEEAQKALAFLGIAKSEIHRELFTAPLPKMGEEATTTASGDSGDHTPQKGTYEVVVALDNEEYTITVPPAQTILEVAIEEGIDPPYACQMGICTTCRAQCKSGVIEMEETEGLSDAELEEGFVLTCQAHPMTPGVRVEFG